ncbi:MAG: hypothetical protein FWJ70_15605 [Micromonosporaceae bacterium]
MSRTAMIVARVGHRAGKRSGPSGAVRRLGLVLASAMIVISVAMLLMLGAVSAQRQSRLEAREPVPASTDGAHTVAFWLDSLDFFDVRQFLLVYVVPVDATAPPPPGLTRWPEPGEAFVSPALLDADPTGGIARRYGRFGGEIGLAGLVDANEWLVYLRPADDRVVTGSDRALEISGFGRPVTDDHPALTGFLFDYGPSDLYQLVLWLVVLPAGVLVAVAARLGTEQRDRRLALLDALGAPRLPRAVFLAGEAAPPVAVGALIGAAVAAVPGLVDVTLPVVDHRVWARDIVPVLAWLPVVASTTVLGILLLVVASAWRRGTSRQASPRSVDHRPRRWPWVVFALALTGAVWTATTAHRQGGVEIESYVGQAFLLCTAAALATAPPVIAYLAGPTGRLIAWLATRSDNVPALIGGRWLQHRWRALARAGGAAMIGLCLVSLLAVTVDAPAAAADQSRARQSVGTGIITVRVPESLGLGDLREQYDELAAQIGRSHRLQVVLDAETAVLVGDCAAIAQLGEVRQCPSGPREWDAVLSSANQLGTALIRGYGTILVSGEPHLSTQVPPGGAVAGLLVVDEDGDQDVAEVARAAFTTLGIVDVHASGQYAIGGEAAYRRAVLWLVPFLSAGLLLLLFATILGALDVFALQARNLGPIGAISGATRFYVSVAVWNIGTALVLSTIVGAGLAVWLAFLFVRLRTTSPPLPWPTVGAGAGVLLLLAFVMVVWCGIVATRAARRWHPVND